MSRTPLFAAVRKALALAFRDAGIDLPRTSALTRRRMMQLSAAAAGAAAVTSVLDWSAYAKQERPKGPVGIVGGGVAGLTAAYRLQQHGAKPVLFEASDRWGGRMFTKYDFYQGMFCERGGELVDSNHKDLLHLLHEFGICRQKLDCANGGEDLYFFEGEFRTKKDLLGPKQSGAFRPILKQIGDDAGNLYCDCDDPTGEYKWTAHASELDHTSLKDYLERCRGTTKTDDWVIDILDVAYVGEYGMETKDQSSLNLVNFIGTDLNDDFKIFGESDEAWRIEGGSSKLIKALVDALTKNQIKMNQSYTLTGIENENGRIALSFDAPGGAQHHTFDAVILALPFTCLRKVEGLERLPLSPEKLKCIRELGMGKNAKIMVGTKSRVWRSPVSDLPVLSNGNICSDLGFQDFWETSRRQKPSEAGILTVFLGGDAALPDKKYTFDAFRADLAKMSPKMAESLDPTAVLPFFWSSYRYTLGSYSGAQVGQYTTMYTEARKAAFDGRLQFAGEHTEGPDNNGYMNGGVKSGNRAAQNLLKIMGLPYALPHAKSCPHRLSAAC